MSFPASGESFALAIKSPRARLPLAMPWTLLTIRNASDFAVNTESPDASQLPIHFLGVHLRVRLKIARRWGV